MSAYLKRTAAPRACEQGASRTRALVRHKARALGIARRRRAEGIAKCVIHVALRLTPAAPATPSARPSLRLRSANSGRDLTVIA